MVPKRLVSTYILLVAILFSTAIWAETVSFRHGQSDPNTIEIVDSFIRRDGPGANRKEWNNGAAESICVHGQPTEFYFWKAGLIRFGNIFGEGTNQIPSGQAIKNATLRLFIRLDQAGGGTAKGVIANPLLKEVPDFGTGDGPATFAEVTFKDRAHGELNWGPPIDDGPVRDVDYDTGVSGFSGPYYWSSEEDNTFIEIDVTDIVTAWYSGVLANHGMLLRPSNDQTASFFRSNEWSVVEERPELVVEYDTPTCGDYGYATVDFDEDCYVGVEDFAVVSDEWLNCTVPGQAGCMQAPDDEPSFKVIPGAITVDGDLSDWTDVEWIAMDQTYFGTPTDVSDAKFAVVWDDAANKINVAAVVVDNELTLSDEFSAADASDRLEVYFSMDGGDYQEYQTYAQQYIMGPGSTTDWAVLGGDPNAQDLPGTFDYAINVTGNVITYECQLEPYRYYGGMDPPPDPDIIANLSATDPNTNTIPFDVAAGTSNSGGYGMLAENTMTGKFWNTDQFQIYSLVTEQTCGDWGYLTTDLHQDCVTDLPDLALFAGAWLECTDPLAPCSYSLTYGLTAAANYQKQDDPGAYTSMVDTFIRKDAGRVEWNMGASDVLQVQTIVDDQFSWQKAALIRYDSVFGDGADQVPTDALIASARLRLFVRTDPVGGWKRIHVRPMLKYVPNYGRGDGDHDPLVEVGEVTYKDLAHMMQDWGPPIDAGPVKGVDYDEDMVVSRTIHDSQAGSFIEAYVTDIVELWQAGALTSYGFVVHGHDEKVALYFYSSEWNTVEERPELIIEYIDN